MRCEKFSRRARKLGFVCCQPGEKIVFFLLFSYPDCGRGTAPRVARFTHSPFPSRRSITIAHKSLNTNSVFFDGSMPLPPYTKSDRSGTPWAAGLWVPGLAPSGIDAVAAAVCLW